MCNVKMRKLGQERFVDLDSSLTAPEPATPSMLPVLTRAVHNLQFVQPYAKESINALNFEQGSIKFLPVPIVPTLRIPTLSSWLSNSPWNWTTSVYLHKYPPFSHTT